MRSSTTIVIALLLLTALAPIAACDVGFDNPLAVFITFPAGTYDIGSEMTVTVNVFNAGERYDPDEVKLEVGSFMTFREVGLTKSDVGLYQGVFTIGVDDVEGTEVILLATATDGFILTDEATDTKFVGLASGGLSVDITIPDQADLMPAPGQTVEFIVLIESGGELVDPDSDTLYVSLDQTGGDTQDLTVTRTKTGTFEGEFTVPTGLSESTEYMIGATADYTSGTSTLSGDASYSVYVSFYDVWLHYVSVTASKADLDVYAISKDGMAIEGASVSLTYTYTDDSDNDQEKTATGTTDVDGKASLALNYPDLGMYYTYVEGNGYVESQGKRENFEVTVIAREDTGGDIPSGFYVEVLSEQPLPFDQSIDVECKAYYDAAPFGSKDIYVYFVSDNAILRSGKITTGADGTFTVPITTPPEPAEVPYATMYAHFQMESLGTYEYSTAFLAMGDFGFELDAFLDPATTITVGTVELGGPVSITIDDPAADGTDELASVFWGVGDPADLSFDTIPEWLYAGGSGAGAFLESPATWSEGAYHATVNVPAFLPSTSKLFFYGLIALGLGEDATIHAAVKKDVTPLPANPAPDVTVTVPISGKQYNGTFEASGTSSDDKSVSKVEVRLDGGAWTAVAGTTAWTYSIDTTTLTSGTHELDVRSYDGSKYSLPQKIVFEVDQPPTVVVTVPTAGQKVNGTVTLSGTAADDGTVDLVEYSIDGGAWTVATGKAAWTAQLDTKTLTSGAHTLKVRSFDGEFYSSEQSVTFTSDQPPTVSLTGHTAGQKYKDKVALAGKATDDLSLQRIEVRVDNGTWTQAQGTTDWTYSVPTSGLKAGTHDLEVRSYDGAQYSAPVKTTFVYEKTAKKSPGFGPLVALMAILAAVPVARFYVDKR